MVKSIFEQINQNVVDLSEDLIAMHEEMKTHVCEMSKKVDEMYCALFSEDEKEEEKKELGRPNAPGIPMGPNSIH